MAAHPHGDRQDRIAIALGVSRLDLLTASSAVLSTNVVVIGGAPDQFDRWADRVMSRDKRDRLSTIAGILDAAQARCDAA